MIKTLQFIISFASLSIYCAHAATLPDISIESNRILVCSHRAIFGEFPENSLGAIDACIKGGVDIIEIDVAKTKDGKLILMHDKTVNRTTNGSGAVKDMTFEEVKNLRLFKKGRKMLTQEKVPTLKEVLERCKDKIYVNLDLKGPNIFDCEEDIKSTNTEHMIMYRASPLDYLKELSVRLPKVMISPYFNFKKAKDRWPGKGSGLDFLKPYDEALDLWGVHLRELHHPSASLKNLKLLAKKNLRLWKMTMWGDYSDQKALKNPAQIWGKLMSLGYNVIMTDEPAALITYLTSVKRH
jgi:glycerophosphoryl diester phosphodiesterase